ncbi:MAG TPA: hypothetical protein VFV69_01670 [Steroidobacteraceae bacterium]|jgi:hypothetical protein|nr:hypothetical protein [Steroidobacteraceae bacterium]
MHTCLTLSNVSRQWHVERAISDLIGALDTYCDAIESCSVTVTGPGSEGEARSWRVDLQLRVFDEVVRATTQLPEGPDSLQSLSRVLTDVYARATARLSHIAQEHQGCCVQCA